MSRWIIILVALLIAALLATVWIAQRSSAPQIETVEGPPIDSPYWGDSDRWIDVDGVTARVRLEGPEGAPVLVMVHGFGFSLETWDDWAEALAADYRVIRMDLPGHALTGPDPQRRYSVPETVEFVASLLDQLAVEEATIIGNSLGGLVSWRLAASRPDLVGRLVLIAPGAIWP